MAMNRGAVRVGVFDEKAQAERAIEELSNAGIPADHISYSANASSGGFLGSIKSLFTGQGAETNDVVNDLTNMGLSQDEAHYYAQQHEAGKTIVAVHGDSNKVDPIFQQIGAYSMGREQGYTSDQSNYAQRDSDRNLNANIGSNRDAGYRDRVEEPGLTNQSVDYTDVRNTGSRAGTQSAGYTMDQDINREGRGTGYTMDQDINREGTLNRTDDATDLPKSMRLREEQLRAEKERVQTGEVVVHKDVVTEEQSINVPVTHEEVVIEKRPVTGDRISDTPIGDDETIRVPINDERVNVDKVTVETGEVDVDKRKVQETQRVSDTVRREEARVDKQGDVDIRSDLDQDSSYRNRGVNPNRPATDRTVNQKRDTMYNDRDINRDPDRDDYRGV